MMMNNSTTVFVEISTITYTTRQQPITDNLVHYRNIFSSPDNFIKRRVDYSKMKVYEEKFRKESERLKTLEKLPLSDKMKSDIAKAGFFRKVEAESDEVRCIYCQGTVRDWRRNDVPVRRHKFQYPTCPFIIYLNVGNEPLETFMDNKPMFTEDPDIVKPTMLVPLVIPPMSTEIMSDIIHSVNFSDIDFRETTFGSHPELKEFAFQGLLIVVKNSIEFMLCCRCNHETPVLKGIEEVKERLHKRNCDYKIMENQISEDLNKLTSPYEDMCEVEFSLVQEEVDARLEMKPMAQLLQSGFDRDKLRDVLVYQLKRHGKDFDSLFDLLSEIKKNRTYNSNKSDKDQVDITLTEFQCVVCLDKPVEVIFLPCGHLKTCDSCSICMVSCPVCRVPIVKRVKKFRFNIDYKINMNSDNNINDVPNNANVSNANINTNNVQSNNDSTSSITSSIIHDSSSSLDFALQSTDPSYSVVQ